MLASRLEMALSSSGPLRRLVLGSALAVAAAVASRTLDAEVARPRRIVLVGLDAADWMGIDPLIASGKLPAFARLRASGGTGVMVATPPLVSPILWTTIATGRWPDDHGVLDFMVDLPSGGQAPVTAASRRVPALWNFFSEAARRVAVVGWWATWPAETVRGTIVSDRVAPQLLSSDAALEPGSISPSGAAARLAPLVVRPRQISFEDLRHYVPLSRTEYEGAMATLPRSSSRFYENRLAHLAAVVAATRSHAAIAESLLGTAPPDLLAVYLEGIDTVSHLFVRDERRGPPAIEAAYRDADALLTHLAIASDPDTLLVVCSDHGFHSPEAAASIKEDPADFAGPATAWHRPYGIVAVAEAGVVAGRRSPTIRPGSLGTVTPLDIAPTLLHAAGLPVAAEMPGRVIEAMLPPEAASRVVERRPTARLASGTPPAESAPGAGDGAVLARLRSLGYIGAQPSSLARQNLGEVLYRRGEFSGAERHLRETVAAQPSNLAAHLWLAKALRGQGRAREALRVYEQAVRLPGGASEAIVEAMELAASSGLLDDGRRLLSELKVPVDEAARRTARAVLLQAEGERRQAEAELIAALEVDAASFDALSRLVDSMLPEGRAREALPFARRAAARAPGSPRVVALLGETLLGVRDAAAAEREFRRALELAPDAAAVRISLARAQMTQGKATEAEATLATAPDSTERSTLLGAAASAQGHWTEAARRFESALAGSGTTPELLNGLGWARFKLGQPAQAAEMFRRSLAMNGDQPEIRRLLAQIEPPDRVR
jgi:tetratricopeptide (TPR) repeat protein